MCLARPVVFVIFDGMENKQTDKKNNLPVQAVKKAFLLVEIVLLALAITAFSSLISQPSYLAWLMLVIILAALTAGYFMRAVISDPVLGVKPRIIYFGCGVAVLAVLFTCMLWPGFSMLLMAGLICMAAGWGIFLWSKQRDKEHKAARQASTYMMFFRLILYSAACLYLLITVKSL